MNQVVLKAVLEAVPVEFLVIDADDNVLAWNKQEARINKRPAEVIGRSVRDCYPKSDVGRVEKILAEMKAGTRDKARFWVHVGGKGRTVMIEYHALHDSKGNYLGCLEAVQDITEIRGLRGEKQLLD